MRALLVVAQAAAEKQPMGWPEAVVWVAVAAAFAFVAYMLFRNERF